MQNAKFKMQNSNIIILFFIAALFIAGCQPQKEKKPPEEVLMPVRVSRVELGVIAQELEYAGNIKADDQAVVYPKVSGKIIEKVKEESEPVKKGEAIVYIDRDETGLKFNPAPVESSLTGVIGDVYVDIGGHVSKDTPIALVVDMEKVKIELDIPERYLAKVFLGQQAEINVDAFPDKNFSGTVDKISPLVNTSTRAFMVKITVDNPEHFLRPGMFARVSLVIDEHRDVPIIPQEAVVGRGDNLYVFIIEDKKALLKRVVLGIRQGPSYEVLEGITDGDLVVVMGQQRLFEGVRVAVEE